MSKRHAREHGRILSVDEETLGSVLVADAASGATTLYVDDAAEFEDDGTGGWLSVNDQVIQYDTVDDDAGTIHLKTALTAAADDGDPVYVWSKLYDTAATVKTALVMVDGEDENTDPIHATLADAVQDLPEGLRGGSDGESCTLVRVSDDEWEVTAVGGRPSAGNGTKFEHNDAHVITSGDKAAGRVVATLTHHPEPESVHVRLGVLPQEPSEYTVDYDAQTVDFALTGKEDAGDRLWLMYAYHRGIPPSRLSVPLGYVWKYATGLGSSTTYAVSAFDDSSWASGPSPFGWAEANYGTPQSAFGVVTPSPMDVWTRIEVTTHGGDLTFDVNVDDEAWVYLDGTLLKHVALTDTAAAKNFTVACAAGDHVIAVHGTDLGNVSSTTANDGGYLGVTVNEGG